MADSKKSRKQGRNKATGLAYRNSQRREHNQERRLLRHIRRYPHDKTARVAYGTLPITLRKQLPPMPPRRPPLPTMTSIKKPRRSRRRAQLALQVL